jgi:hypothetical protein
MKFAPLLAIAVAAAPAFAQDTVWRCKESDGRPHYTNIKKETEGKGCQVVTKEVSVVPVPAAAGTRYPDRGAAPAPGIPSAATATPPGFPRVDRDTQRSRDDSRRKILADELATEERNLVDAKSKLTQEEGVRHGDERNYQRVLDRLKPYQDAVERHERNVAALKKEISGLK